MFWNIFIFNKSKNYQKDIPKQPDIKDDATTSPRRLKFYLRNSETSQRRRKRYDDVSAWSGTFKLVTKMSHFFRLLCSTYFFRVSGSSVFLRYQLVRCHNVSKTLVSLRYQLWRLCDVFRWSVSLRYQVVRRYDVSVWSYWSVLFTY